MSWSISAVGKPAAVIKSVTARLNAIKCKEPEETIKASVGEIITTALAAFPEEYAVQVDANGSQTDAQGEPGKVINNLSFTIKPLYGFVS